MAAISAEIAADSAVTLGEAILKGYRDLRPEEWEVIFARLTHAREAGERGEMRRIADSIGITLAGLSQRYSRRLTGVSKHGPEARLTAKWEGDLARHTQWQAEMGDPLSLSEVASLAKRMGNVLGVDVGSRSWMRGFRKRQNLSLRRPQALEKSRAIAVTTARAKQFYNLLTKVYGLFPGIDASRVYNMDETGLEPGNVKPTKVLCAVGTTHLSVVTPGDRRHVSAVVCGNAKGELIKTMLLYPKSFKNNEKEMGGWPEAVMRFGDSAYMDDSAWEAWTELFVAETKGNCVLILDQHRTRYNLRGLATLAQANVGLLTLPAHTTHALQPLDVAVFRPMKAAVTAHVKRAGGSEVVISTMIKEALATATRIDMCPVKRESLSHLITGFRATGIWPLNSSAVSNVCVVGDWYAGEIDKKKAAAALAAMANGHAAAGGAGAAPGGADNVDDDDAGEDDSSDAEDDTHPPAAAPPDAEAAAASMATLLMPSPALIAAIAAEAAKTSRPPAPAVFLTGKQHLEHRWAKAAADAAALREKEDKKAAKEERKRVQVINNAALLKKRAEKRAARAAAKAIKDAQKAARRLAKARRVAKSRRATAAPATATAPSAAAPAPKVRKLKVVAAPAAAAAPTTSGIKRQHTHNTRGSAATGGDRKRFKFTPTFHSA